MKFSVVLALLPLALAAPAPAPAADAAAAARPCCNECSTTLFKACRDKTCWDSGYFSVCTSQCIQNISKCEKNCNTCK